VNQPRRRKPAARSGSGRGRRPASARGFWGSENRADEPASLIGPSDDPTAMIRSLGPPPLPGRETVAEHYFVAVYEKAAALAIALAAASGLLDTAEADD
jgi:hypothetical protein